ncbi:precorrin-2 C(20)-methyltransferase [Alkalibaculum sp. M08DMB]|uniref:Precorrin-2 C(20)-methyltransferase n=1 Tax=Alkalibaculum sporogenes TaxID=2655001 RepID=A0A6A7K9Y0_9FIRM|nr:precorrin-2 C(20)-methyltransferase [Alkalibaculum sporogenes]MPW26280.1 precorrin-2 C(20)-methyltransferase [Alkalibaculum sporogenes]
MLGTLYGIGVGPGDSGLITQKAIEIIKNIDIIVAPISKMGKKSKAFQIAKPHLKDNVETVELEFPMIDLEKEKDTLTTKWKENAEVIAKLLEQGKNVAFLTLGDPMVYSTYSYMIPYLEEVDIKPVTIPGITSFCASASALGVPIVQGNETFCVLTQITSLEEFDKYRVLFENIIIMKPNSSRETINEAIKKYDLYDKVYAVSNCGDESQVIATGLIKEDVSYFTIILIKGLK